MNAPPAQHWPAFAPRGGAIGAIWVVLFAAMGAARYLASSSASPRARTDTRAVTGLIALCLAYPFYTHFIPGHATELVGNIISFAYAAWLIVSLRRRAPNAAQLIAVVAAWIVFATALVVALVQLNGWNT